MNTMDTANALRPAGMTTEEWQLRLELAACYRLFDWMGWTEAIYNHITLRVPAPGGASHYLINPYGLHYAEVTARNLLKVDTEGRKVDASPWPVNPAGFVIHSVVHAARADAHCIMHTHTTAGMAVACKEAGLRHDNFYSAMLYGRVGYHDFEGITTDLAEQPRLQASLGSHEVLVLRNHGMLVVGADVAGAFSLHWTLQRGCEVQMAADGMAGANRAIPHHVLEAIPAQRQPMRTNQSRPGELMFQGMLRRAGISYAEIA